jgi:DNA-binding FadR family transcriptional regulator
MRLALERGSVDEIGALAEHLRHMADPEIDDVEYLTGLFALQDLGARMTSNRVLLLLTNSLRRFLERAPLVLPDFSLTPQRLALAPGLKRLAVAVEARDTDSAVRATVDLLRRESSGLLRALEALTVPEPGGGPREG